MNDEIKTNLFQSIVTLADAMLEAITKVESVTVVQALQSILVSLITLLILYEGIRTLMGRTNKPIKNLVWSLLKKVFILCLIAGGDDWLKAIDSIIVEFYKLVGGIDGDGGHVIAKKLDEITDLYLKGMSYMYSNLSTNYWGDANQAGPLWCMLLMSLGFFVLILNYSLTLFLTIVSIYMLMALLPVVLFLFMWSPTRHVFSAWCGMILGNLITLLVYMSVSTLVLDTFKNLFSIDFSGVNNFFIMGTNIFVMCIVLAATINLIVSLAKRLAIVIIQKEEDENGFRQSVTKNITNTVEKRYFWNR